MGTLNLDDRRAERDNKPHKLTLDGDEWELPAKLPLVAIEYMESLKIRAAVGVLFGEDAIDRLAPLLDQDDIEDIFSELYGVGEDAKPKKKEPKDHLPKQ